MKISSFVWACLLGLFAPFYICRADTIYLKNGNVIQGRILEEGKKEIIVEVAFGNMVLPRSQISKIQKEGVVDTVVSQGERLFSLGAIEHALSHYEDALRQHPDNRLLREAVGNAYAQAARYYLQKNQIALAREYSQKAKQTSPASNVDEINSAITQKESSALELVRQADLLLKRGEYRQALVHYYAVAKSLPEWHENIRKNMAVASVYEGNRHLKDKSIERARFYFNFALECWPEIFPRIERAWVFANVQWLLETHYEKGNWKESEKWLSQILRVCPTSRPALFLLGMAQEKQGNAAAAWGHYCKLLKKEKSWNGSLEELEHIRQLAQKNSDIQFQEAFEPNLYPDVVSGNDPWESLESVHFTLFHHNENLAQKAMDILEEHWHKIVNQLAPREWSELGTQRFKVYIHPSKAMFVEKTGASSWMEGLTKVWKKGGNVSTEIHLYQSAPLLLSSIAPHELTHALYPSFLGYRVNLPLWLNEGIAISSEPPFRQRNRLQSLRVALRKKTLFSLEEMISRKNYPSTEEEVELFYAQSFSVVHYLLEKYGSEALFKFAQLADRSSIEKALQSVYSYPDLGAFESEWTQWVSKIAYLAR